MAKNKIKQAQRRAIRAEVRGYVKNQYTILGEVVKKRPRFVPLFVWRLGAKIFIDTAKLQDFMENGIAPKSQR